MRRRIRSELHFLWSVGDAIALSLGASMYAGPILTAAELVQMHAAYVDDDSPENFADRVLAQRAERAAEAYRRSA